MIIFGKKYNFKLTVGAYEEIAELCPDHDIKNIGNILAETHTKSYTEFMAQMAVIMNKWYIKHQEFNGEDPGEQFTIDIIKVMPIDVLPRLISEILTEFNNGQKPTVETEPEKNAKSRE